MKNSYRSLGIALISAALALIATLLRCIASVADMDFSTGFYGGSVLIDIANITITAAIMILIASLFLKPENIAFHQDTNSPLWYVPASIMTISIILLAFDVFLYIEAQIGISIGNFLEDRSCVAALLTLALAFCAAAFFAASCLSTSTKGSIRAYLGMGAALFFGMYAAFLFFRVGGAIHQPQKIVTEMAAVAASIFLLEETRVALGKERWGGYVVLGTATALVSAYAVLPTFTVYIIKGKMIAHSWGELAVLLSVLIFAVCRITPMVISAIADVTVTAAEEAEDIPTEEERQISDEENTGN